MTPLRKRLDKTRPNCTILSWRIPWLTRLRLRHGAGEKQRTRQEE